MFEPIPHAPRYRLVAEALIARIGDGSLAPGTKLPPDRVLVAQLGVSRATLREALIALEVMGHVETRFGAGAFVATRQPAQPPAGTDTPQPAPAPLAAGPFEKLEARRLIEGELAALAAARITASQIDTLWDCISRMESNTQWAADADERFHATIAKAAGNGVLAEMAAQFWTDQRDDPLWRSIEKAVQDTNRRPALVDEHEEVVAALTAGEPDSARIAMHRHLDSFAETLLAQWETPEANSAEAAPHARLKTALETPR